MVFAKNIICFFRHILQFRIKNAILSIIIEHTLQTESASAFFVLPRLWVSCLDAIYTPFRFYRVFILLNINASHLWGVMPRSDLYPFSILPCFHFAKHKCFAFMGCYSLGAIYTPFRFYRVFILLNINASHLWGNFTLSL